MNRSCISDGDTKSIAPTDQPVVAVRMRNRIQEIRLSN